MANDDPKQDRALLSELCAALAFLTRVPISALGEVANRPLDGRRGARLFPVVGAAIGAAGGLVLVMLASLGVPPLVAAGVAVATTIGLTGALHEDGLADTADGFGGGVTAQRKLEIMKDSRIGTFGALAVGVSVLLRVTALGSLVAAGGLHAVAAWIAAEAASRGAMVKLWHDLPSARPDGMADRAGQPDDQATLVALIASVVIVALAIIPTFGTWAALTGTAFIVAAGFTCARLFLNQIGGHTGDTLGTGQQCTAIAFLIAMTPFA